MFGQLLPNLTMFRHFSRIRPVLFKFGRIWPCFGHSIAGFGAIFERCWPECGQFRFGQLWANLGDFGTDTTNLWPFWPAFGRFRLSVARARQQQCDLGRNWQTRGQKFWHNARPKLAQARPVLSFADVVQTLGRISAEFALDACQHRLGCVNVNRDVCPAWGHFLLANVAQCQTSEEL